MKQLTQSPLETTGQATYIGQPILRVEGVAKSYGRTQALRGIDLTVNSGEILGIVGHNGAGKSTLMRLIAGLERADAGSLKTEPTQYGLWNAGNAEAFGVRMAYQELALCGDLTVTENAYLTDRRSDNSVTWKSRQHSNIEEVLEEIFPNHGIQLGVRVNDLSLAQRQMVETARSVCTKAVTLLILDEPTESLGSDAAEQLYAFLHRFTARGGSALLISHRLHEVCRHSNRIAVLKDGEIVKTYLGGIVTESMLVLDMGGDDSYQPMEEPVGRRQGRTSEAVVARVESTNEGIDLVVKSGELVGLAGLAGQGQETLLRRLWSGGWFRRNVQITKHRAYVPGDRQTSGIFPLWNVAENLTISVSRQRSVLGVIRAGSTSHLAQHWVERLKIKGGAKAPITTVSGGNQQKVLVARAFATDADVVLLDDPFRGVDMNTKTELYALMKSETSKGRSIIWYSTENQEMQHCDRVYVLRSGQIVCELTGAEITEERIIAESFENEKGRLA
jgi:ribose transport system ATP-binding protein